MLESAGNDYMNLTIDGIRITVVATQDTVESDSFGKTYDADAVYPIDSADSLKKSLDEVNASETVDDAVFTMGGNFEYSDETFEVAPGKNVTIDLAGKKSHTHQQNTDAFAVTDGSLTLCKLRKRRKVRFQLQRKKQRRNFRFKHRGRQNNDRQHRE